MSVKKTKKKMCVRAAHSVNGPGSLTLFCLEPHSCKSQKGVASQEWNFTSCILRWVTWVNVVDCRHQTGTALVRVSELWQIRTVRRAFVEVLSRLLDARQEVRSLLKGWSEKKQPVVLPLCGLNTPGRNLFKIIIIIIRNIFTLLWLYCRHGWFLDCVNIY